MVCKTLLDETRALCNGHNRHFLCSPAFKLYDLEPSSSKRIVIVILLQKIWDFRHQYHVTLSYR
jgi:hypothetical protein